MQTTQRRNMLISEVRYLKSLIVTLESDAYLHGDSAEALGEER